MFYEISAQFEVCGSIRLHAFRMLSVRRPGAPDVSRSLPLIDSGASIIRYRETDRSEPSAPNLVKLADFFDVSVDYLLGRTDL